jgi:hypothetical protein
MTIENAAKLLHARLQGSSWLTAVGIGEHEGAPCIVLYVKTTRGADLGFLQEGWEGFPVVVRKMKSPRLVSVFWPKVST